MLTFPHHPTVQALRGITAVGFSGYFGSLDVYESQTRSTLSGPVMSNALKIRLEIIQSERSFVAKQMVFYLTKEFIGVSKNLTE